MKTWTVPICSLAFVAFFAGTAVAGNIVLQDWTFYVNGTTYNPPTLPGSFNVGGFDFGTGLGSITVALAPGTYTIIGYFDHDIRGNNNVVNDESGFQFGTPTSGQIWEVDEPGFSVGDLVNNVIAGALDNQILDGSGTHGPQDIAMAIGWSNFVVSSGDTGVLSFVISATATPSGFYLEQTDPDGTNIFYSSFQGSSATPETPEPGSWLLLGTGVVIVFGKILRESTR